MNDNTTACKNEASKLSRIVGSLDELNKTMSDLSSNVATSHNS